MLHTTVSAESLDFASFESAPWIFDGARPSGYLLSNLNALGNEPLIETLELAIGGFATSIAAPKARRRNLSDRP